MTEVIEPTDRTVPGIHPWQSSQFVCGLGFIASAAWLLWTFPVAHGWLIALAVVLGIAQWRNERTWLIAVPVLIGTVDLGAWSGRFLFSEQDALFAVLVGAALTAGQYRGSGRQVTRASFAPLWLIGVATLIGVLRGVRAPLDLDANAFNGYLTSWNAMRVAKGPFWALVLWPLLAHQLDTNRPTTEKALSVGMAAALVGLGVFVLWERGFVLDMVHAQSLHGLFATWLDLSGSYRITGPLSQMHLGGEAIDGFLVLCVPFAWLLLVQARRPATFLLGVLAVGLGGYAVLTTFTRTTYAASAFALVAFAVTALSGMSSSYRFRLVAVGLYAAIAAAVLIHGFRLGGSVTTAGSMIIVLAATAAGIFQGRAAGKALALGFLILLAAGFALSMHGMTSSKWSVVDTTAALATTVASAMLLAGGGLASGRALRSFVSARAGMALLAALAVLLPLATLSLSGSQMEQRFAAVGGDLDLRERHWRDVLALMPADLQTTAFGMGAGRLPRTFLFGANGPKGTWQFGREESQPFLRLLGTASLCYGQRMSALEPGVYRVQVRLRNPSEQRAHLAVKLQPRRLLESESWQPATQQIDFVVEPGVSTWKNLEGTLRLPADSSSPWDDPRFPVLALANEGEPLSAVDVAYVRLIDSSGRDHVDNGSFTEGGDRWFAYNDFQHLEWHTKNFYLAQFFDMGAFGLAAYSLAFAFGLASSWRKARRSSLIGSATAAAIVGVLALGTTGTLLDVPQVMTLMLVVVTVALWRPALPGR